MENREQIVDEIVNEKYTIRLIKTDRRTTLDEIVIEALLHPNQHLANYFREQYMKPEMRQKLIEYREKGY